MIIVAYLIHGKQDGAHEHTSVTLDKAQAERAKAQWGARVEALVTYKEAFIAIKRAAEALRVDRRMTK